jgi:hypothetical protein
MSYAPKIIAFASILLVALVLNLSKFIVAGAILLLVTDASDGVPVIPVSPIMSPKKVVPGAGAVAKVIWLLLMLKSTSDFLTAPFKTIRVPKLLGFTGTLDTVRL